MKQNESNIDRIVRVVLGLGLLGLGFGALSGAWAIMANLTGVVLLATAAFGFCPLYYLAKFSTLK